MRGPRRAAPRQPLADEEVRALLVAAEVRVLEAHANLPAASDLRSTGHGCSPTDLPLPGRRTGSATAAAQAWRRLRVAEQDLLMVRLAADTGARRGELAGLRFDDLTGRVLRIRRAVSAGQLTTPKSGHGRALTLGADTADLWHHLHDEWAQFLAEGCATARPDGSTSTAGPPVT